MHSKGLWVPQGHWAGWEYFKVAEEDWEEILETVSNWKVFENVIKWVAHLFETEVGFEGVKQLN